MHARHRSSLLLSFLAVSAFASPAASTPTPATEALTGPWHGALEAGPQVIALDVRFENGAGQLDVRQQGLRGLPLAVSRAEGGGYTLKATLPTGQPITFEGALAGDKLSGTFQQGAANVPFWLVRGERSTAAKPTRGEGYEDREVAFENGAIHLAGTLTLPSPAGRAPPPVAILITGSGPQDRNEEVFGFPIFEVLAQALARDGIATLRFDDRGVGQSTGDFLAATTADFATDVEAAIRFLRARPEVDAARLGLIGHSEGGLIAPMVAARDGRIAFVVLLAGPGQPMDALLLEQIARIGRAEGQAAEKTKREQDVAAQAIALLRKGKDLSTLEGPLASLCGEGCKTREATAAFVKAERWKRETRWFRFFIGYDPRPALRDVHCPVLALGGSLDMLVPSDLNLPLIQRALAEAKNPRVSVQEIAGMNHLLQAAKTGAVSEFKTLPKALEPTVAKRISAFIQGG